MIILANHNSLTNKILQDILYKHFSANTIINCRPEELIDLYIKIYDGDMAFDIVISDDLNLDKINTIHKINPQVKYILVVHQGIKDDFIVKGYKHGMFNFIRWPARADEIVKVLTTD